MSDDMETVDALEHTHDDGVTHSHDGGDQEHTHTEVPAFNLADLNAVKQIIEVSSRRGSFNASELSAVGATYDRLMAFLQHHVPAPVSDEAEDDVELEIEPPVDNNAEPEIDRD
jgi:hypothetical protein